MYRRLVAVTRQAEQGRARPGPAMRRSWQDARPSAGDWGVAKLVRHGILIPAFEGSSPSAPAIPRAPADSGAGAASRTGARQLQTAALPSMNQPAGGPDEH